MPRLRWLQWTSSSQIPGGFVLGCRGTCDGGDGGAGGDQAAGPLPGGRALLYNVPIRPVCGGAVWVHGQGCCAICQPVASGRIYKAAFLQWAKPLLSVSLQKGHAEMYRRSGIVISREQRLRYDSGHEDQLLPEKGVHVLAVALWLCV